MIESNHVQEDDENKSLLSKSKLDVEEVDESNHIQEYEEKSSLPSNFDLEIKDVSDATTLVVEETESEKEFSLDAKSIIEFVDVMPEEIPHGFPPMRGIQHQIDLIPGLVFPNKLASMGEGVSLSLPRNGFPVGLSLEISDPFARELVLSQVPSLIYVPLSRELASFYERNSSVFSQVVLAVGADLGIDLPAVLKGDSLYLGSGDDPILPLVYGSVVPDPILCKGKGINVSLIPAGYHKLASYIDRVLKDSNAEISINVAYKAGSGDLSSDLHIVVLSISDLGRSDEGVRPMSSVPHGAVYGDSTNTAEIFPVAAADDLAVADRAGSGSAFHHGWF